MANQDYKPKLSVELTPEQHQSLQAIDIPHGWIRAVFSVVVDDIIELNAVHGPQSLALIIAGRVKPSEVLPSMATDKNYPKNTKTEE